jgi:hypothetical protein
MRATARDWERLSKQWTGTLAQDFKTLGEEAGEKFLDYARERGLKADPLEDFDGIAAILMGEIDYKGVNFAAHYLLVAKSVFENINSIMGLGVNLSDPVEQRIVSLGGTRKLKIGLDKQAKDSIADALREGRDLGEGADDLARRIVDLVGKGPWATAETRAMVVARTETKYAQNASSLEAYKGGENISGVLVFDAQLGPTDEECMARNQRIVTFEIGQQMVENEHPNGTISLAPYMGELPDDADVLMASAGIPDQKQKELAMTGGNGKGRTT